VSQKTRYLFRKDDATEEVKRKYRDIVWLHNQFKKEFSGLKLPNCPENNLKSVESFFDEILKLPDIASSYLLLFFTSCTNKNRWSEFIKIKETIALTGKSDLQKSLNLESLVINDNQLKELKNVVSNRPEIQKVKSADLDLLCDNVYEFTSYLLGEFGELNKVLTDIKSLFETLGQKLNKAAESFGMISLQFKKLNYAKTQFVEFEQSKINLDLIYTRYKLVFFEMGELKRECSVDSIQIVRKVYVIEKRLHFQRRPLGLSN